jgi:hypothetical protein
VREHAGQAGRGSAGSGPTSSAASSGSPSSSNSASALPPGPAPASVHLLVANGSNQNGLAAQVATDLAQRGFAVLTPVTALTTVPATLVYPMDSTGQAALDEVLAALGLGPGAVRTAADGPPPVQSATGADLVIVAGPGLAPLAGGTGGSP